MDVADKSFVTVLVSTSRCRQILLTGSFVPLPAEISRHCSDKQNVRHKPKEMKMLEFCLFFKHLSYFEIYQKKFMASFMSSVYLKIVYYKVLSTIA